jgi:hypothetical protein
MQKALSPFSLCAIYNNGNTARYTAMLLRRNNLQKIGANNAKINAMLSDNSYLYFKTEAWGGVVVKALRY